MTRRNFLYIFKIKDTAIKYDALKIYSNNLISIIIVYYNLLYE